MKTEDVATLDCARGFPSGHYSQVSRHLARLDSSCCRQWISRSARCYDELLAKIYEAILSEIYEDMKRTGDALCLTRVAKPLSSYP